jgi:predicted nucleotidyltransferase
MIAGPLIASRTTLEFPSKHSRVVPEVIFGSVSIDEQEITSPGLLIVEFSDPQDVRRKVEINNAAITFIESLHPFLQAP